MVKRLLVLSCFSFGLLICSTAATAQAGQLGPVHVDPQDSKAGVRMVFTPPGTIPAPPASPEATKTLSDLIAANGTDPKPLVPWHVQLTYDEFDEDGDNVHSGTIEEFYVG
jgi:hypothetical protein